MRLPLIIEQHQDSERATKAHPGYTVILNNDSNQPAPVRLSAGCVCCSGRSALRDALNGLYIDWAHDREAIKGAVLLIPPEAVLSDLEEFLTEDAILASRWALQASTAD